MHDVFINYRTGDAQDAATLIERDLAHRFGSERIFFASKTIKPGENFRDVLDRAVRTSKVLLAVIGPRWLTRDARGRTALDNEDDWIRREITEAFTCGVRVIPVLVGRETRLSRHELPSALAGLADCQYRRFDHRDAQNGLAQLSRDIVELVPGLADRSMPEPSGGRPSSGSDNTHNTMRDADGFAVQARDYTHRQWGGTGPITGNVGTIVTGASGPVNTGSGHQYNAPHFSGDRAQYIAGAARDTPDDEE
jgi:hypothetical protein